MSTTTVILASGEADSALTIATWALVAVTGLQFLIEQHVSHGIAVVHHAHMTMWRAVWHTAQNVMGCVRCGLTIRRNFADFPVFGYAVPFRA